MPWFRFVTRYAWLVLAIALAASVASVFAVQTLVVDNDPETWLLISSDEMESYREYKDNFGNDEYLVVGYRHPEGVLSEPALDIADRLTAAFEKMDGVLRVTSLANVEDIRSEDDLLSIGPLVRRPVDGEQLKDLLGRLAGDPLFARTLASDDGRAGAITIKIEPMPEGNYQPRLDMVAAMHELMDDEDGEFHVTGAVEFDLAMYRSMERDNRVLLPIMLGIFVVLLGSLFRTWSGILLPTITVGSAVLWTYATMALTGFTLNMMTAGLTIVLLGIGVADSVHFLTEYQEKLLAGSRREDAIVDAGVAVFTPCLFTSVTTALGFLGLVIIRVQPIVEFGLFAAMGSMFAFVATMTIVPAAIRVLPEPRRLAAASSQGHSRYLKALFGVVSRHRVGLVMLSAVFMVVGLAGLPRVKPEANWYEYLAPENPTRIATDFVENNIGGVYTLELLVRPGPELADTAEPMKEPQVLRAMNEAYRGLVADPQIESALSPAQFVETMNRTMNNGDPQWLRLPERRDQVGQLMLMYEMDAPDGDMYQYMNFDFTRARITARARISSASSDRGLVERVRTLASGIEGGNIVPTGMVILFSEIERQMISGMVLGFSVALAAVSLMMMLVLRNIRHGLLAMIPAVLPLSLVLGMTGWVGQPLGPMSIMMANVALGVAVDNAIHLLTRYRRLRAAGSEVATAIEQSVTVVGRPVLYTAIVLCLAFVVLGFSDLVPTRVFGLLTAMVLAGSLGGALITLPATVLMADEHLGRGGSEAGGGEA
ncbi:MAG: MMPL family transporter [Deltaproteobacteria bacterium]|nr:MMPL family transporter [Deltaproteobacteria bacterium]